MKICSVEDCQRTTRARGFCPMHYKRFRAHGDPAVVKRGGGFRGSGTDHPHWKGRNVSYRSAHMRVQHLRGKADTYACECGAPAKDWAYDYSDPDPLVGRNGKYDMVYSADVERYKPMCRPCHTEFDKEHNVVSHSQRQYPHRGRVALL